MSPSSPTRTLGFDLIDLDFSDTPLTSARSSGIGTTPFTPNTEWKLLQPDPPSALGTPSTQTSALQMEVGKTDETDDEEESKDEGNDGKKDDDGGGHIAVKDRRGNTPTPTTSPTARTASIDRTQPGNDQPTARTENQSESGESTESTSSNLRPVATPFTSKKINVVRSRTPPSFYSDRAERGSQAVDTSPLSSPVAIRRVRDFAPSPESARGNTFYGEGEGYTSHPVNLSPKTAMFALPESRPIRISPPRKPVPVLDTTPSKTGAAMPSSVPTPRRVPLPDSQPSSTSHKLASAISSPLTDTTDAPPPPSDVPSRTGVETPISRLTRSMSEFSLREGVNDAENDKETSMVDGKASNAAGTAILPTRVTGKRYSVDGEIPSEPSTAGPQTPASPKAETLSPAISMPTRRTQRNVSGLMESIEEVEELERHWAEYRDAYGKLSGGVEEVVARLRHNMTGHSCSDNSHKDELRAARQQILLLQRRLQQMQDEKTVMNQARDKSAGDLAFLKEKCDKITKGYKALDAAAQQARQQEEAWRRQLDVLREKYDLLDADKVHWHKRELLLGKDFVKLEDDLEKATIELGQVKRALAEHKRTRAIDHGPERNIFSAVLIECSASVIDESFIKRGSAGGKELGQNILATVRPDGKESLVVAQMFLNFPDIKKRLMLDYVIKKEADLHDFLDGFRSVSGLFTVVDTDSPADKLQDHFKLYKLLGAERMFIASRKPDQYRPLIQALPESARGSIFAVQSQIGNDPFDFLGTGHLLHVEGLMQPSHSRKEKAVDETPNTTRQTAAPSTVSTASRSGRATPPHMRPASSAASDRTEVSVPRKPLRDRFTAPLISPPSGQTQRTIPEPPTPTPEIPPAPWAANTRNATREPRVETGRPATFASSELPWWQRGGTLNDEVQAARASSYAASTDSPSGTPRAPSRESNHAPIASPTPRRPIAEQRRQSGRGLAVPVNDMESLGGSPPDSDEDHPNVSLPHSAVKRVQRPIEFSQPPSDAGSGRSRSDSTTSDHRGGQSSNGNAYAGRSLAQQGLGLRIRGASGSGSGSGGGQQRAPSTTGTNSTPLGPPRNSGLGGTTGKLHGFTVQGWSSRQGR